MDLRLLVGLLLVTVASAQYNSSTYLTCEEINYCDRLRNKEAEPNFELIRNSMVIQPDVISFLMLNRETNGYVDFNITVYDNHVVRFYFQEQGLDRYDIRNVFTEDRVSTSVTTQVFEDRAVLSGFDHQVIIWYDNFKVDVYVEEMWVFSLNYANRLTMENSLGTNEQAFGFDVFFPQAVRSYGIPEHADRLALRTTTFTNEPYRLWNSDVPGYDVNSRMALYGSVPILYGHSVAHTAGVFLANSAEQWVDIVNSASGVSAYFMVEGGAFDLHVLLGPTPEKVAVQYTSLTGTAPLPQLWALGYQQSRWNYLDQEDVLDVIGQFDANDIPIDVIWGDVDTQDGHRYFTWNPETFGDSVAMLNALEETHRKFVTHVDPHVKVDTSYFVYTEGRDNDYFVKNSDGTDFVGECWPGDSTWIDFLNDEAAGWYSGLFDYSRFNGSTPTLAGIWNDMNEPAVFDDETEKTMDRLAVHSGEILHRDLHNMYGFTQTRATYEGLMNRDDRVVRPFILSRSFFAGTQRYAGVWTGDNVADWDHLHATYPMCLSISLAGISMCGADIGGFYGEPDTELLTRWYQAAIWLPFFRAHAANGTERREPYLFDEETVGRIRTAIQKRYAHLPSFYTAFYEHFRYGYPVIRPLFYEFPTDANLVDVDHQLIVGKHIMVKQVSQSNLTTVPVYFPGGRETLWYDVDSTLLYRGVRWLDVPVTMENIPEYYRGGSIIFRKNRARSNTYEMESDPFTCYLFLNDSGEAYGTIYTDDYHSFDYVRREFNYFSLFYENDSLFMRPVDDDMPETHPDLVIESYVIYRPPSRSRNADGPVHVEPIVVTKTPDGRDVKDIRMTKGSKIRLL